MTDLHWKRLQEREAGVDQRVSEASRAGQFPEIRSARLEKTLIICTAAIVEAIWKARE